MSSYNRVLILGNLGQDPTLKKTKSGHPFCRLSVATQSWQEDDDGKKKTVWHSVHVFGAQAETASQCLRKGRQVLIEGHIENSKIEVQGETRWNTWVTADRITFVGKNEGFPRDQQPEETLHSLSDIPETPPQQSA